MTSTAKLLVLIAFLNSLCIGLIVPILSPHIGKNGGNDLIIGLLAAMTYASQMISKIIMTIIEGCYGKKFILSTSLGISLVSYMVLILSPAYWMVFVSRFIFAFSSRAEVLCKRLIPTESPVHNIIDTMCIAGIVLGNILAGHLYAWDHNFAYNASAASFVILINLFLYKKTSIDLKLDDDKPGLEASVIKIIHQMQDNLKNVSEINYKKYWSVLLLRFMLTSALTIILTKYPVLLKINYKLDIVYICYTVAYQNILIFISHLLILHISQFVNYSNHLNLIMLSCSLVGLCYAPRYDVYLLIVIIMILTRTVFERLWNEKILSNKILQNAQDLIQIIAGIVVPVIFGWACNEYSVDAFKVLNVLPLMVAIYVVHEQLYSESKDEIKKD